MSSQTKGYGSIQSGSKGDYHRLGKDDELSPEYLEKFGYPTPEDSMNILSRIFFWWCNGIVSLGYKRPLEHADLPAVSERDAAAKLAEEFEENWRKELHTGKPSLVRALRRTFGWTFFLAGLPKLVSDALGFVGPLAMGQIIVWLDNPDPLYVGYLYTLALLLGPLLQSIIQNQYFYLTFRTGMHVKAAMVSSVYRKSLKLTSAARQKKTQGEIVNLQSNDTQRLMDLCPNFHLIWSAPLQIIVALVLLYTTIGSAAFVGLAIMILLIPIQGVIAAKLGRIRKQLLDQTDTRIKLMNEILQGIRVIKFYAWEQNFSDAINDVRAKEVVILTSQAFWRAFIGFFLIVSPVFVSMATFVVYSLSGHELTPEVIFPSLAYFNLLRFPLTFMPVLIIAVVEAKISVNRLWEFMTSEEYEEIPFQRIGKPYLRINDATFAFDTTNLARPTLSNISLQINDGELVMVVGQVGSGKSSIVNAFLGGIQRVSGSVEINGTIAYAAQQAWIMNQTVKENILFGLPYDEAHYHATIHAACLKQDLAMLPGGDATEIGEKGINLSGGQKQRVSLARAVYSNADIYILDDVLSAVDSHVGKHIFEECIMGALKHKARLFVTHQNHFLPHADRIIVVKDGQITHQGTYQELVDQGVDFASLVSTKKSGIEDIDDEISDSGDDNDETPILAKEKSARLIRSASSKDALEKPKKSSKLIDTEERETGVVSGSIYWAYIMASGGGWMLFAFFFTYTFCELVRVAGDLWLSLWSTPEEERKIHFNGVPFGPDLEMFFLYTYVILGTGYAIFSLLKNVLTAYAGVFASKNLHNGLFVNILKAPVSFFDTTPVGRILNRFTKDLDNVDNLLPQTINQFLGTLFICISTLVLIAYITPFFLAALVPIMFLYFFVMQYYRKTSRELQRLDSVSRSPIYNYFAETLSGVDTVRAYKLGDRFCGENEARINHNNRAYWMVQVTNRWLSLRLEILGSCITFAAAIFAVVAKDVITPSQAGLSITYALQVTGFLNWVVRMATQGEAQMNAVERIKHYSNTENEAPWIIPERRPPASWPQKPEIRMDQVFMKYRPGLEPVLKGITLEIRPFEKVGVVGRTGAGKSSLMLALFRMTEIYQGEIVIDNINVATIGLHDLRSRLTIIPQDPVLFSGTVRSNLDPFNQFTDPEVWLALEQVKLAAEIRQSPLGLQAPVSENGSNWSLGQRQLFCFARALLKKTNILVMDEATSSVDMETDNLIQKTIRTKFNDRTVLTIAHRLSTIMDSDRVIVMDAGRVVEFDTPANLLKIPPTEGVFSSMVQNTGNRTAHLLRKIANRQIDVFGNTLAGESSGDENKEH